MRAKLPALLLNILYVASVNAADLKPSFPGKDWERVKPEAVGMSSKRFEVLRSWLKTQNTTAMMVVIGGRIAFEYGDLSLVSKVASVRKSILAMLYGKYEAEGRIDLSKTVKQLGLDDLKPFLPSEESATLLQLLTARSGIYLDSGNEELFDRKLQRKNSSLPDSVHPEYAMYLSTRDMARLGLLMLRQGVWKEAQILPKGWSNRITTLVTHADEIHPIGAGGAGLATTQDRWGYGMLWRFWPW